MHIRPPRTQRWRCWLGGYNAIVPHNPCSKALLDACDRLGMLMPTSMWTAGTSIDRYDYGTEVEANYRDDLADLVARTITIRA